MNFLARWTGSGDSTLKRAAAAPVPATNAPVHSKTWTFDGARTFEGVTPDLDLHCARVNRSAESFFLKPFVSLDTWIGLAHEGIKRFDANAELYVRPMYWAETGSLGGIRHDPDSTRWCLSISSSKNVRL